jgi:hypothetical protein
MSFGSGIYAQRLFELKNAQLTGVALGYFIMLTGGVLQICFGLSILRSSKKLAR